ncbi:Neprilysin-1 [Orchesella cincta]|uniref:Neprilysin-1 n=1 Tax=Orchesella cincta TaxID=48709 RepID=A0A1D2MN46_ORCCI|nr:Neprilysin-1 [Orchesella cincta]
MMLQSRDMDATCYMKQKKPHVHVTYIIGKPFNDGGKVGLSDSLANAQRSPPTAQRKPQDEFQKHQKELQELQTLARNGGYSNLSSITKYDPQVCYTYDCIEAAKEFMVATNFTVNPCQSGDWLKFTCVRRTMNIEGVDELDDMHQQGQVGYLGSVALGQTLAILESKNLTPILKKAATYYAQCEKWKHGITERDQVDGILKYLDTFGEWPLLTGRNSPGSNFDWKKMMANTMKIAVTYGVAPYLFDIFIEGDDVPLLFTGELGLHLSENEIVEVIKILSKGRRNITTNDKQIKEMTAFMSKLTHPSEDKIQAHPIKNITRHHNFGRNFKLEDFYKGMLAGTRVKITPDTKVSSDIEWLINHVKAVNEADPRVIANILFLQTAAALLTRLTTLTHAEDLPDLEKYRSHGTLDCVRDTYEKFDYAMSHEYIRRYYDHKGTPIMVKLVDNLKYGFVKAIEHVPFLTSQSKVFAIDKSKDIHTFIAAESWVLNEEKLKEYYTNMDVSRDKDFVSNHVAALRFQWAKFLELKDANMYIKSYNPMH